MKPTSWDERVSAVETYLPRLELVVRLVAAVITATFVYAAPLQPLGLSRGGALAAVVLYALGVVSLWLAARRWRDRLAPVRGGLWLDLLAAGAVVAVDPFAVPVSLLLILMAVLGNGLQHGLQLFMEALLGAVVVLVVALALRLVALGGAFAFSAYFLLIFIAISAYYCYLLLARVEAARRRAEDLGRYDPLTRLYNRRAFAEAAGYLMNLRYRSNIELVFMFADLDDFKAVNDRHGHERGDQLLRQFAEIAQDGLRSADVAGRYGGDEFVFVLTGADLPQARRVAERLQQRFAGWCREQGLDCGVSIGLGQVPARAMTLDRMLDYVDRALYQAKAHQGKGGIVEAPGPEQAPPPP